MIFLYTFTGLCLLIFASGLIIARYRLRAAVQELTLDCRLEQHLLEHVPQLPRPFVRVWYGGSDVQTHVVAPTRKQILADRNPSSF